MSRSLQSESNLSSMNGHYPNSSGFGSLVYIAIPLAYVALLFAPMIRYLARSSLVVYFAPIGVLFVVVLVLSTNTHNMRVDMSFFWFLSYLITGTVWLALAVTWGQPPRNAWQDSLSQLLTSVSLVLLGAITLPRGSLRLFLNLAQISGVIVVGLMIISLLSGFVNPSSGFIVGDSYLTFSHLLGLTAVLSVGRIVVEKKAIHVLTALILYLGLGLSFARGALVISFGVGLLVFAIDSISGSFGRFLIRMEFSRRSVVKLSIPFLIVTILFAAFAAQPRTLNRLLQLVSSGRLDFGVRGHIWEQTLHLFLGRPLIGNGIGAAATRLSGSFGTPHNWILQLLADGGLVGFLFFLIGISIPFWSFFSYFGRRSFDTSTIPLLLAYLFVLLDYLKSFDFYTGRSIFILGSLSMVSLSHRRWLGTTKVLTRSQ